MLMDTGRPIFNARMAPQFLIDCYQARTMEGTQAWLKTLDENVNTLFSMWEIDKFEIHPDAHMGLVLVCSSSEYGETVIKMYPPFMKECYFRESYIYQKLPNYHQCKLLDCCPEKFAMLLERVVPGDYISYPRDASAIIDLFQAMEHNKLPISALNDPAPPVINVWEQLEYDRVHSQKYEYHPKLMAYLVEKAAQIYEEVLSVEEKCLLHGDVYFKNALRGTNGIQTIDPIGYQDAFIFEYIPFFLYELLMHSKPCNCLRNSQSLIAFFGKFTDISKIHPAAFVFLVKQVLTSVYDCNDQLKRANSFLALIRTLYLDKEDKLIEEKVMQAP